MSTETERSGPTRGLFSVAQIQHVLRVEFGRAQRYRYPVSVLCLAIDPLGALRDRLGFDAKEAVVEAVTAILAKATRSSDYLGRTPDDRLVAVVPHTDEAGARRLAGRLLSEVRALAVAEAPGERLTLSIGLMASGDGEPAFHDVLLSGAEAAQAEAVAAGGDRLVVRASGAGPR